MHGKGIYTWKDGRRYEGEYLNDKKHVKIIIKWKNYIFYNKYINNIPFRFIYIYIFKKIVKYVFFFFFDILF